MALKANMDCTEETTPKPKYQTAANIMKRIKSPNSNKQRICKAEKCQQILQTAVWGFSTIAQILDGSTYPAPLFL